MRDVDAALTIVDVPDLSAAVLDSKSDALCARLHEHAIPYVLYSGRQVVTGDCAGAPLIPKPAPAKEVVAKIKQLLR
jgi:hypothetical protein